MTVTTLITVVHCILLCSTLKSNIWEGNTITGSYQKKVDPRGRLHLPAKVWAELGEVFYITISADTCLTVYNKDSWQELIDKINATQNTEKSEWRPLLANAVMCEADKRGYITIPQHLRDFAKITDNATIIGCGEKYELWAKG